MPLENAQFISELNPLWPLGSDGVNTSDDHHRNTKTATQQSFPNISGEVTADQDDLNTLTGAATVGSGLNPVGTIIQGAFTAAPNGYLPCDGSAIDPGFTALIAIVGANTPDLRGQFLRGWSTNSVVDPDGPRAPLEGQADAFASHTHTASGAVENGNQGTQFGISSRPQQTTPSTNAAGGAETRPVNIAVLYAIKW